MIPIFTLDHTPGATDTTDWREICHMRSQKGRAPCIVIWHQDTIFGQTRGSRSRERKRPFGVFRGCQLSHAWSWHVTLEAAQKAAAKLAREEV
jgi:hypothetical protein